MLPRIVVFALLLDFCLLLATCKSPEPTLVLNLPPAAFIVTAKIAPNGADLTLNWTKAKDPNGDAVAYAVVWKDTLVRDLTDTTYTIKNIGYNTTVMGSVVAFDAKRANTTALFSSKTSTNSPPNTFIVTVYISGTATDLTLSWHPVSDPDGDPITYTVIGKDTLVKNTRDTSFTIRNVGYGTTVSGSVIASDNKKASTSVGFNFTTDDSPYTAIPDVNFEKALIDMQIDDKQDGKLLTYNARNVSNLSLDNKNIKDMTGISAFINLRNLRCSGNLFSTLNLSKNVRLLSVDCYQGNLSAIDVSKNIDLFSIDCSFSNITKIDLTNNVNLLDLYCQSNKLTLLD